MGEQKRGETFVMQGPSAAGGPDSPIDFSTFLLGLVSTAFIHLGDVPHPETGQPQPELVLARQSLELLSMLREKTQGNLTPAEEKLFDNLLADLRLRYVEASKR